jgi:hypothetical protein
MQGLALGDFDAVIAHPATLRASGNSDNHT